MRECAIVCCLICALQCKIAVQWIHFEARSLCDAYNMKCVLYKGWTVQSVRYSVCFIYSFFVFRSVCWRVCFSWVVCILHCVGCKFFILHSAYAKSVSCVLFIKCAKCLQYGMCAIKCVSFAVCVSRSVRDVQCAPYTLCAL